MKEKRNIKDCILFFILGMLVCGIGVVLADIIHSDEVLYDSSNSHSSYDNVQDALDDVYSIINRNSLGFSLLTHNPVGLSDELVAGLYRFQGVQDVNNSVDNYICFGTTNKSDCVENTDKYMYRIIGINTSGQMKLLKKEALNTTYRWNSTTGADWAHSDLYIGLNGSYFLTNTTYIPNSSWSGRIALTNWYYSDISNASVSAETMYLNEISGLTVNNKIGLMYLHDYYYAIAGGNNCRTSGGICKTSWMHISKNEASNNIIEWTMARYNYELPWHILTAGGFGDDGTVGNTNRYMDSNVPSVRPVFFLNSNEKIASGSGTITDPYILR